MASGIARWHSLMYSTAYLLFVCGIPATVAASLLMLMGPRFTAQVALRFCGTMIAVELLIAIPLLLTAKWLTQRARK
jgi:hypothetical protein